MEVLSWKTLMGRAPDLAEAALDGVGGAHDLALHKGLIAEAGEKLVEVVPEDRSRNSNDPDVHVFARRLTTPRRRTGSPPSRDLNMGPIPRPRA